MSSTPVGYDTQRRQRPVTQAFAVAKRCVGDCIDPDDYDAAAPARPLEKLGMFDCRFAVNDAARGEPHLFCARPAEDAYSYCAHHRLRMKGAGTVGERQATAVLRREAA